MPALAIQGTTCPGCGCVHAAPTRTCPLCGVEPETICLHCRKSRATSKGIADMLQGTLEEGLRNADRLAAEIGAHPASLCSSKASFRAGILIIRMQQLQDQVQRLCFGGCQ